MNTLIKLPNFPVSICTQDGELTDKEIMIDANIVEDNDGFIKFLPYVDPKLIYMSQHNSSIGKTWTQHNSEFAKFIYETEQNKIQANLFLSNIVKKVKIEQDELYESDTNQDIIIEEVNT